MSVCSSSPLDTNGMSIVSFLGATVVRAAVAVATVDYLEIGRLFAAASPSVID